MNSITRPYWEKPLHTLTQTEWESLCDGCGLCCLHKLEDEDTGEIYHTRVACQLLDLNTCQCSDYVHRKNTVPDCIQLDIKLARSLPWLPKSCAYYLRARGKPLPSWHPLITGDTNSVQQAGIPQPNMISEVGLGDLQDYIV